MFYNLETLSAIPTGTSYKLYHTSKDNDIVQTWSDDINIELKILNKHHFRYNFADLFKHGIPMLIKIDDEILDCRKIGAISDIIEYPVYFKNRHIKFIKLPYDYNAVLCHKINNSNYYTKMKYLLTKSNTAEKEWIKNINRFSQKNQNKE